MEAAGGLDPLEELTSNDNEQEANKMLLPYRLNSAIVIPCLAKGRSHQQSGDTL
jgi:hypothetical protein